MHTLICCSVGFDDMTIVTNHPPTNQYICQINSYTGSYSVSKVDL